MSPRKSKVTDLVRKEIEENGIITKRGFAKYLVDKYPDLFIDLEFTRGIIRNVTGTRGKKRLSKNPEIMRFYYDGFESWSKENLNLEDKVWRTPYQIPSAFKQLNIIADLHSVHMNPKVMQQFLKRTEDKSAVLINGDLMDSESLSRHLKGHNVVEYERELEICHQLLKGLKEEFNHVYFKAGNHDFWLERYLLQNAREVFRLMGLNIETLLRLNDLGVHYIHNLQSMTFNDLDIIHGHEFNGGFGAGKFPAAGYVDKWQTFKGRYDIKILASHCHRQDYVVSRKSKDGKYGYGWVTPAMCQKSAEYNPYAGWDNGWAVVHNNDGITDVRIIVV